MDTDTSLRLAEALDNMAAALTAQGQAMHALAEQAQRTHDMVAEMYAMATDEGELHPDAIEDGTATEAHDIMVVEATRRSDGVALLCEVAAITPEGARATALAYWGLYPGDVRGVRVHTED